MGSERRAFNGVGTECFESLMKKRERVGRFDLVLTRNPFIPLHLIVLTRKGIDFLFPFLCFSFFFS